MVGAEVAARLVDQPVDGPLVRAAAVPSTQTACVSGIDRVPSSRTTWPSTLTRPRSDQLLAMPPRADAGMGQEFVETFHIGSIVGQNVPIPRKRLSCEPAGRAAPLSSVRDFG